MRDFKDACQQIAEDLAEADGKDYFSVSDNERMDYWEKAERVQIDRMAAEGDRLRDLYKEDPREPFIKQGDDDDSK